MLRKIALEFINRIFRVFRGSGGVLHRDERGEFANPFQIAAPKENVALPSPQNSSGDLVLALEFLRQREREKMESSRYV